MAKILYGHHFVTNEVYNDSMINRWFGARFEHLKSYIDTNQARFTTLSQAESYKDSLVLTFDDGYKSIFEFVLPYLTERQIPCTIFLRTDVLESKIPYEISLAYLCISKSTITLPDNNVIKSNDEQQAYAAYNALRLQYKFSSVAIRKGFVNSLYKKNGMQLLKESPIPFMNWDDVKSIIKNPLVTIGAHTVNHPALKKNFAYQDYKEVTQCKENIENKLQTPITQFAYPYGANNIVSRYLVKKSGYSHAYTTQESDYDHKHDSPYAIPRYNIETII